MLRQGNGTQQERAWQEIFILALGFYVKAFQYLQRSP